jgi:ATP-dependent Clp protease ATP-binding subunit ClpA
MVEIDCISSRRNSKEEKGLNVCVFLPPLNTTYLIYCSEPDIDNKAELENDLRQLREQLLRVEQRGPEVRGGLKDRTDPESADNVFMSLLAKNRRTISSPDIVTPESIAAIVEKEIKIPVRQLLDTDKERLMHLENSLAKKVSQI